MYQLLNNTYSNVDRQESAISRVARAFKGTGKGLDASKQIIKNKGIRNPKIIDDAAEIGQAAGKSDAIVKMTNKMTAWKKAKYLAAGVTVSGLLLTVLNNMSKEVKVIDIIKIEEPDEDEALEVPNGKYPVKITLSEGKFSPTEATMYTRIEDLSSTKEPISWNGQKPAVVNTVVAHDERYVEKYISENSAIIFVDKPVSRWDTSEGTSKKPLGKIHIIFPSPFEESFLEPVVESLDDSVKVAVETGEEISDRTGVTGLFDEVIDLFGDAWEWVKWIFIGFGIFIILIIFIRLIRMVM